MTDAAELVKLADCPFCGGTNPEPELNAQNWPMVQCIDCGACGPCIEIDAVKAAAGWNKRALAAQQDAGEAIVEAVLDAARLYVKWVDRTGDYPHDEEGCGAHEAIIEAVRALEASQNRC